MESTSISEQIRENSFNHANPSQRLPHWMTQTFSQGKSHLVNDPIDNSSDISLSLPETLSLPSAPSVTGQKPTSTFPRNFPKNLDDRYRELQDTSKPLRLNWNILVAPLHFLAKTSIKIDSIIRH